MARIESPTEVDTIEDLHLFVRTLVTAINSLAEQVETLTALVAELQKKVSGE